ncbi:trichohyalin isoform X3 [Drosophila montana]|uniref:trichohyalin isoform X3 n=1 Tax=Drosophila montana TaxID=40370 RepID=UPI00313D1605
MAADEAFAGFGELIFSLLIGYLGALEFAFVARHLYHWTCRHPDGSNELIDAAADAEELPRLRERLDKELAEAAAREAAAGGQNAMQDGVVYSNGFRVDKREALATELERQRRIEEETRQQLAEAEHKLAEERGKAEASRAEAEENARRLLEAEKQREESERKRDQEEQERENERKLIEAEKQREAAQRESEENERKLQEAEREREENERRENERKLQEAESERKQNERKLQEIEREREENERRLQEAESEREENERKLREAEKQRELDEGARERKEAEEQREREENERKLEEAEEERQAAQRKIEEEESQSQAERLLLDLDAEQAQRDEEIVERLLAAERERKLSATESELEEEALVLEQSRRLASSQVGMERKQKSIEENARLFMEAEEEMVMLQQRMLQAAQEQEDAEYAGMVPVVEEPCVKKIMPPRFEEPTIEEPLIVQRVKTQFGQTGAGSEEPYVRSKTLTFPGVSDEGSSVEPDSSQQSSFSTQVSEDRSRQMTEEERQEPEGEDYVPDVQYTEDYLRSLDGIKSRPLMREDGSGRRRAFKKRRSSGSSNSSRDSRASRDEELKMFTSLEEEELKHGEKADYNPINYSSEPALRVKSHHRRHKRSPAKDVKPATDPSGSLEMLGEEGSNPWGELLPEPYKNTEFWKREKALSIDEEELDLERRASGEEVPDEAQITPKESSFEHATDEQNALAANALLQQRSKEQLDRDKAKAAKVTELELESEPGGSNIKSNTCS